MSERERTEPTLLIAITLGEAQFSLIGIVTGVVVASNVSPHTEFIVGFWAAIGVVVSSFIRAMLWLNRPRQKEVR